MMAIDKTFHIHDTTIGIWREHLGDPTVKVDWLYEHDWQTHEAIRMLLVRSGFSFHQDPETKKRWRSLAKTTHTGKKQDLHFYSRISGRHHEVTFFEDVVRDNRNGGRFTHNKLGNMPYQRQLKAKLAMGKVRALLLELGFTDTTESTPALAIDRCMQEREKLGRFQGERFYTETPAAYNSKDAHGNVLRDGQTRYFWDYYGRLGRGQVFHHINNMWWVIASPFTLLNIACFDFLDWQPGMPIKKPSSQLRRAKEKLKKAVDAEDFEKAIQLRDRVKRMASLPEELAA